MCDRAVNRCVERPVPDAGTDAGSDAGTDAGDDATVADASTDASPDASLDSGASKDAGKDVATTFDAPTADATGNTLAGGSGCGCAVPGSRGSRGGALSLLALAVALVVRRRRAA